MNLGDCNWCKQKNVPVEKHHFPIPRRKKGKKVVQICLNCHYKYHYFEENDENDYPCGVIDLRGFPDLSKKVSEGKKLTKKELARLRVYIL